MLGKPAHVVGGVVGVPCQRRGAFTVGAVSVTNGGMDGADRCELGQVVTVGRGEHVGDPVGVVGGPGWRALVDAVVRVRRRAAGDRQPERSGRRHGWPTAERWR